MRRTDREVPPSGVLQTEPEAARGCGVSFRASLVGLGILAGLAFLIPYLTEVKAGRWAALPRNGPIPPMAILVLALLLGPVNGVLRRLRPRWSLKRRELLAIYAVVAAIVAMTDWQYAAPLMSMLTASRYLANPGNRWDDLVSPHIPSWLQVNDVQAVRWAWEGIPAGHTIPWSAWRSPLLWWGAMALCLWTGSFSLVTLLRRDWIEGQRLTFPLAQIPLEMVGHEGRPGLALVRQRVFWLGFAIPFSYGTLELLHRFYPAVPYLPMSWPIGESVPPNVLPWAPLHELQFNLSWGAIGIMCLLPTEVSLSFWVFNLWYYAQLVFLGGLGYDAIGGGTESFNPRQFYGFANAGALIGFGLFVLYQSRRVLLAAVRSWWDHAYRRDDPAEILKPRYAVLGLALGLMGMLGFGAAAGVESHRLLFLLIVFYVISVSFSRVVAAAGTNYVEIAMWPTRYFVDRPLGSVGVRPVTFGMLNPLDAVFMTEYNESFMTYAMNDMKVFHSAKLRGTTVVLALAAAAVLMLIIAPIGKVWAGHQRGFTGLVDGGYVYGQVPQWEFGDMAQQLQNPKPPDLTGIFSMLAGSGIAVLLAVLPMTVPWWRLSPVGYLISGPGWGLNAVVWANAFVGWIIVSLILHFRGRRLYLRLRPAFIGLFLGDTATILLASAVLLISPAAR